MGFVILRYPLTSTPLAFRILMIFDRSSLHPTITRWVSEFSSCPSCTIYKRADLISSPVD